METYKAAGHLEPKEIGSFWRYGWTPCLYTSFTELFRLLSFVSFQLEFGQEIYIKNISIYETYNSGAVTNISVWNTQAQAYQFVYQGEAEALTYSRIFTPQIDVSLRMQYKFSFASYRFLVQCHLVKRSFRIFDGEDIGFYTQ